jgi:hypothetical protein
VSAANFFIDLDVLGLDDELASLRHGIPRIPTEIHEPLINLCGVR